MAEAKGRSSRALLLELVVVILGVGIALAGDSWWQGREERARVQDYLVALHADLIAAGAQLEVALERIDTEATNTARQITLLRSPLPVDDSISLARFRVGADPDFAPLGTLRALVETGDIRLIPDPGLRSLLTREYALAEAILRRKETAFSDSRRLQLERIALEEEVRTSPDGSDLLVEMVRGSPEMIAAFRMHARILTAFRAAAAGLRDSAARLGPALEAATGAAGAS